MANANDFFSRTLNAELTIKGTFPPRHGVLLTVCNIPLRRPGINIRTFIDANILAEKSWNVYICLGPDESAGWEGPPSLCTGFTVTLKGSYNVLVSLFRKLFFEGMVYPNVFFTRYSIRLIVYEIFQNGFLFRVLFCILWKISLCTGYSVYRSVCEHFCPK